MFPCIQSSFDELSVGPVSSENNDKLDTCILEEVIGSLVVLRLGEVDSTVAPFQRLGLLRRLRRRTALQESV